MRSHRQWRPGGRRLCPDDGGGGGGRPWWNRGLATIFETVVKSNVKGVEELDRRCGGGSISQRDFESIVDYYRIDIIGFKKRVCMVGKINSKRR